jgi:hypothetical protein
VVAQINYPSFKHNTQDSIEQVRGRSHEEGSSQIFMLDDMQFERVWTLYRLKQKKTENYQTNLIKSENYQENKPWSQAHIHLQKSEQIMETKHQFIF